MEFRNIKDFFKNNPELLNDSNVQDLMDYTREMEGEVQDKMIKKNYEKEDRLIIFLNEILLSINDIKKQEMEWERWKLGEPVNYKECLKNLKSSIIKFYIDNNISI